MLDGAAAGAGFGILFIAFGQVSSDAGFAPLAANQLFGAAVTVVVAAALRQPWSRGAPPSASSPGVARPAPSARPAPWPSLRPPASTGLGVAAVLASLYPAVTVMLASIALGERLRGGQRLGIGICTLAVATLALG